MLKKYSFLELGRAILFLFMFANPRDIVRRLSIGEGMKVADIGAGSGAYTLALAEVVGSDGKVYAIDVQRELLMKLKTEAQHRHIHSIETVWGDAEKDHGTKLADASVDVAFLSNVLFQAEHKEGLLREVKRIVRSKGRIFLIDWSDSFGGMGPLTKDVVKKEKAKELMLSHGFSAEGEFSAGAHHYGLIFSKV